MTSGRSRNKMRHTRSIAKKYVGKQSRSHKSLVRKARSKLTVKNPRYDPHFTKHNLELRLIKKRKKEEEQAEHTVGNDSDKSPPRTNLKSRIGSYRTPFSNGG